MGKAMAAMKAMRAMKKKTVSKIAKGKFAKSVVFRGTKAKTLSGLTKSDLIKNKRGKIVTKKQVAAGKKAYNNIKGCTSERIECSEVSAQGVGMSTPLERRDLGWYVL